jgi:hypothetical protein
MHDSNPRNGRAIHKVYVPPVDPFPSTASLPGIGFIRRQERVGLIRPVPILFFHGGSPPIKKNRKQNSSETNPAKPNYT